MCVCAVYPPSETLFHLDVSNHWRLEACLRVTAHVVPPTVYRGPRRPAPSCGPARGRRDYPLQDLLTDGKEGRKKDGFNSHVVLLVVPPRFMTDLCLISTILTTLDKDPFIATRSCKDYPRPLTPHPSSLCKHRAKYIQGKELSLGITCRAFHAWLSIVVFLEAPRQVTKLSRHVT